MDKRPRSPARAGTSNESEEGVSTPQHRAARARRTLISPVPMAPLASAAGMLTPLHPTAAAKADFTPYTVADELTVRKQALKEQSDYGVLPIDKKALNTEDEQRLFGQILVKWGKQNVNLHEVYKKHGVEIGGRVKLPGIYVVCACVEAGPLNRLACANCSALTDATTYTPLLFKVGLASDLAHRFDQYHTYYPYGFNVISVFVMTDPNGNLLPPCAAATKLLKYMESHFLSAFRDVCDYNPTTRPGSAEFFRMAARDVREGLLYNTLTRLTHWDAAFIEKWRKLVGARARLPVDSKQNVVYAMDGLRGILQPFEVKNFSSLVSEPTTRTRRQATMTTQQAVEAQAEGTYALLAAQTTKTAKKQTKARVPGGASAASVGGVDWASEEDSEYVQSSEESEEEDSEYVQSNEESEEEDY